MLWLNKVWASGGPRSRAPWIKARMQGSLLFLCGCLAVGIDYSTAHSRLESGPWLPAERIWTCATCTLDIRGDEQRLLYPQVAVSWTLSAPRLAGEMPAVVTTPEGPQLVMHGAGWYRLAFPQPEYVGPNATLELELRVTHETETLGLGLARDGLPRPDHFFQCAGRIPYGTLTATPYDVPLGTWRKLTIPVGQYYTGTFSHIVLGYLHSPGDVAHSGQVPHCAVRRLAWKDNHFSHPDHYATSADTTLLVSSRDGLLRNDFATDRRRLQVTRLVKGPQAATKLELRHDGSFSYQPHVPSWSQPDFIRDEFLYEVTDGRRRETVSVFVWPDAVRLGQEQDAPPLRPLKGGLMLVGGHDEPPAAVQWLIERAEGGDLLVLQASENPRQSAQDVWDVANQLAATRDQPALNSVETLVVTTREQAQSPRVAEKVRQAEALLISGGDQNKYLELWTGTALHAALRDVLQRGEVVFAGNSAGLAIVGHLVYIGPADLDGLCRKAGGHNPYHPTIVFYGGSATDAARPRFVEIPLFDQVLMETHFRERERMDRLITLMARAAQDRLLDRRLRGIGIDEQTALLVEPDGRATVVGKGAAYFLTAPGDTSLHQPEACRPQRPLTYRHIAVYKLAAQSALPADQPAWTGSFDLRHWQGDGGVSYHVSVVQGQLETQGNNGRPY